MNYIKHLNAVFQQFYLDSRLNPTHISLYVALFQFWNFNRFPELFYINRQEVMTMAKIGSKATYHRCLKSLNDWKYIQYLPSHNPYKGSQIKMLKFDTSSEPTIGTTTEQVVVQALAPYININKQIENNNKLKLPKCENEVFIFFKNKEWPMIEAKKFFNHYKSIGWKLGGKIKITDWHSTAENWMLKSEEIQKSQTENQLSQNAVQSQSMERDNLKTTKIKDYGQPL